MYMNEEQRRRAWRVGVTLLAVASLVVIAVLIATKRIEAIIALPAVCTGIAALIAHALLSFRRHRPAAQADVRPPAPDAAIVQPIDGAQAWPPMAKSVLAKHATDEGHATDKGVQGATHATEEEGATHATDEGVQAGATIAKPAPFKSVVAASPIAAAFVESEKRNGGSFSLGTYMLGETWFHEARNSVNEERRVARKASENAHKLKELAAQLAATYPHNLRKNEDAKRANNAFKKADEVYGEVYERYHTDRILDRPKPLKLINWKAKQLAAWEKREAQPNAQRTPKVRTQTKRVTWINGGPLFVLSLQERGRLFETIPIIAVDMNIDNNSLFRCVLIVRNPIKLARNFACDRALWMLETIRELVELCKETCQRAANTSNLKTYVNDENQGMLYACAALLNLNIYEWKLDDDNTSIRRMRYTSASTFRTCVNYRTTQNRKITSPVLRTNVVARKLVINESKGRGPKAVPSVDTFTGIDDAKLSFVEPSVEKFWCCKDLVETPDVNLLLGSDGKYSLLNPKPLLGLTHVPKTKAQLNWPIELDIHWPRISLRHYVDSNSKQPLKHAVESRDNEAVTDLIVSACLFGYIS